MLLEIYIYSIALSISASNKAVSIRFYFTLMFECENIQVSNLNFVQTWKFLNPVNNIYPEPELAVFFFREISNVSAEVFEKRNFYSFNVS